jgi:ABC-type antimicrobial peptide transport system permease subunit
MSVKLDPNHNTSPSQLGNQNVDSNNTDKRIAKIAELRLKESALLKELAANEIYHFSSIGSCTTTGALIGGPIGGVIGFFFSAALMTYTYGPKRELWRERMETLRSELINAGEKTTLLNYIPPCLPSKEKLIFEKPK